MQNEWKPSPHLAVVSTTTGSIGRQFPAVDIAMLLTRESTFFVLNVALPLCLFSFMCLFQFALPRYDTANRLNMGFTLVLTAVAFKFSITDMVPKISYMTVLDRYLLLSSGLIVLATFQTSIYSLLLDLRADYLRGRQWGEDARDEADELEISHDELQDRHDLP